MIMGNCNYLGICAAVIAFTFSISPIHVASAQPANYDGVYAGSQTLTENGSVTNYSKCLRGPFKRQLVVKEGAFTYTYNPTYQGQIAGTVSAEGDVAAAPSSQTEGVSLSGRIQGDSLTGEVWSLYCTYTLELKRVR
jgi:hypothetical protein